MSACPPPAAGRKCAPCEGLDDSAKLSLDQIKEQLESTFPLWTLKEKDTVPFISRSFVAKNFQAALDAINAMGVFAENEGHHPDFHLTSYRNVQVDLYTHSLQGITENDFALASLLDTVEVEYSPKWLKEHPDAAPKKPTS